jgi:hypothetical protein
MPAVSKPFNGYRFQYYAGSGSPGAYITCWQDSISVGTLVFAADGTELPANKIQDNSVILYYPLSRFSQVLDILRNEKPLYLWLNTDNGFGHVGSSIEPVGEEERL